MKVYELMNALADLPSGAKVVCSVTLTTGELTNGIRMGEDDTGSTMYSVSKELSYIDSDNSSVCLEF